MLDLAKIALLYHMVKQHDQNVLPLNAIITNNSLFNMQISIYPHSRKFKRFISPYFNMISYVVKNIQVTYYYVNTELCCYGCCQGGTVSLMYIVTKLKARVESRVCYNIPWRKIQFGSSRRRKRKQKFYARV